MGLESRLSMEVLIAREAQQNLNHAHFRGHAPFVGNAHCFLDGAQPQYWQYFTVPLASQECLRPEAQFAWDGKL